MQDKYGKTSLHVAAIVNNENLVKALLDKGANVNVQDECGRTPLYYSIHNDYHIRYNNKVIRVLLKAGADPLLGDCDNEFLRTCLKSLEEEVK